MVELRRERRVKGMGMKSTIEASFEGDYFGSIVALRYVDWEAIDIGTGECGVYDGDGRSRSLICHRFCQVVI